MTADVSWVAWVDIAEVRAVAPFASNVESTVDAAVRAVWALVSTVLSRDDKPVVAVVAAVVAKLARNAGTWVRVEATCGSSVDRVDERVLSPEVSPVLRAVWRGEVRLATLAVALVRASIKICGTVLPADKTDARVVLSAEVAVASVVAGIVSAVVTPFCRAVESSVVAFWSTVWAPVIAVLSKGDTSPVNAVGIWPRVVVTCGIKLVNVVVRVLRPVVSPVLRADWIGEVRVATSDVALFSASIRVCGTVAPAERTPAKVVFSAETAVASVVAGMASAVVRAVVPLVRTVDSTVDAFWRTVCALVNAVLSRGEVVDATPERAVGIWPRVEVIVESRFGNAVDRVLMPVESPVLRAV